MSNIIVVKDLVKKYGDFTAVNGVSFDVVEGEVFGILGPNGAGKTTTLEMIEGLKKITAGEVTVDGLDVKKKAQAVKQIIGVQLQASSFFNYLNLQELVVTFASLYGLKVKPLELLEKVNLVDKRKSYVKELSGGQKQRLSIAVALVNKPRVLFLDEPTTGLDPQARHNMWELIREIKKQHTTIVITTHYMEEAEVLCDRIAIMDAAKIIALDTPVGLLRLADAGSTIEFHADGKITPEECAKLPGAMRAVAMDHQVHVISSNIEATLPALFDLEKKVGASLKDLRVQQATLEDVFLKLTGKKLRD